MNLFSGMWKRACERARPPMRVRLSKWIESNIVLPEGVAMPGKMRLWAYQGEIADAMSDPEIERVTMVKPVRVGFTALLNALVGSHVVNDPAPILFLLPTESDCRDYMVSEILPIFDSSPVLRGLLEDTEGPGERNTLLSRRFTGGSLKIIAARSPRNLRRHTSRIIIADEADAMEVTSEGAPINIVEKRSLTFANRKIVIGSTPTFTDTSAVLKAYGESDQRIYEVPCPHCHGFFEMMWGDIVWPKEVVNDDGEVSVVWDPPAGAVSTDLPDQAVCRCRHCKELIDEREKTNMVRAGRWRTTKPEVKGHAGFRLNTLVSLLSNASWSVLAKEFIKAKSDPTYLQTFVNTFLGQGWTSPSMVDETALAARAEEWDLNRIPVEVIFMSAGCDVQDDRVEMTILGWARNGECLVLGHVIVWGSFADQSTWDEIDEILRAKYRHPWGGMLRIDACAIDAGDGDHYETVLNFCIPKTSRRVVATKGRSGAEPAMRRATGKTIAGKLWLVGVDTIKNVLFERMARGQSLRFSKSLEPSYYEQLASQRRVVRYNRGMPQRRFEMVSARARKEALDCLVYATAARQLIQTPFDRREAELKGGVQPRRPITDFLAR